MREPLSQVQQVGRLPGERPGFGLRGRLGRERREGDLRTGGRLARAHRPRAQRHGALHLDAPRGVEHGILTGCRADLTLRQVAGAEPGRDVVGDAVGEDQALEQGVGGEPVGAVHSGARALAAGVEPVERRAPEQVGLDAT